MSQDEWDGKVYPEVEDRRTDRSEPLVTNDIYDQADLDNTCNNQLPGGDQFDGPVGQRKRTDVFYLILFVLSNVAFILLIWYIYIAGDFERLLHWSDFRGELCGVGDLSGKEYTYWPEPEVSTDLTVCTVGCPSNTAINGICLYETDHETDTDQCYTSYPSTPFAKLCIPADEDEREEITELLFQDGGQVTRRVAGDILKSWDVILIGTCISFALSLIFLIFFRFPGSMKTVVALFSLIGIIFMGGLSVLTFYEENRLYELINDDEDNVEMNSTDENIHTRSYFSLGLILAVITGLVCFVMIGLLISVRDTFPILRLAARPLKNIPLLLLIPIVQMTVGALIFVLMISSSMSVISIGEMDTINYDGTIAGGLVKIIHYHELTRWVLLFTIPVCLWWLSFIATAGEFIVSFASSVWFFSKEKRVLENPIRKGIYNMFWYHLGSLLLGSVLVPMFRLPKALMGWCRGKCGRRDESSCARGCCGCLYIYDRFIRYLSDDAFTYQAIWGEGFARSARKSYFLKTRSSHNMKSLGNAGDFTIWIFSIAVTLASPTFVMYWIIFEKKTFSSLLTDEITSAVAPAFIALMAGAFMAQVFSSIFRACIHSSIVCFLADHEMFVEMQGFADQEIYDFVKTRGKTMSDMGKQEVEVLDASPEAQKYDGVANEPDDAENQNLEQSLDLDDPNKVKAILKDEAKLSSVTKQIFDEVDTDRSGSISKNEMQSAMQMIAKEMGIDEPTRGDVDKAMKDFDTDGTGKLSVGEFRAVVVEILNAIVED